MAVITSLLWLGGCDGQGGPLVVTANDTLPATAPGLVLLATLGADGRMTVGGTIQSELYVDLDAATDTRDGFRYVVRDAAGAALYARSTPGPLIVREFLAYYGEESGYDLLTLLPQLGRFPIQVPLLDGASTVDLEVRGGDGAYAVVGQYDLGDATLDDQGVSEAVLGVETLFDAGPPEHRLDLVLVGDGYTADEMDAWRADAAEWADALLATAPFSDFPDQVNIHRVDLVSAESGVSYDCTDSCRTRDTALQSVFPLEVVNALTGTAYRTEAVFQLDQWVVARAASAVPWDFVGVVANTAHDGGFAVHYATVTNGRRTWTDAGVHELGHLIGLLGDEYTGDACIRSDALGLPVNITDLPTAPPWSEWVEDDTPLPTPDTRDYRDAIGAFTPAYNCEDLYRPARSCRMLTTDDTPFCAVCTEAIVRRLFRYGDPAEGVDVALLGGRADFVVRAPHPDATITWSVDGQIVNGDGAALTVTRAALGDGVHSVEASVQLETGLVRSAGEDLGEQWVFRVE